MTTEPRKQDDKLKLGKLQHPVDRFSLGVSSKYLSWIFSDKKGTVTSNKGVFVCKTYTS